MAIGTTTALILAAAAAAGNYYNTQQTAKRQDNQAAESIRNQTAKQRQADEKVNQQVADLEGSNSADEKASRLNVYMDTLRRNKSGLESGFAPVVGSDTFIKDSAKASGDVNDYATRAASLLSRMDAPGLQRQGESFSYGNLATDLGLIGREAQGQSFIDELRLRGIRRNPWIDAASSFMGGLATGGAGAAAAPAATTDWGQFGPGGQGWIGVKP